MTTTTIDPVRVRPAYRLRFGGVLAGEWTKFASLRSTWVTTGVSAVLLVALGLLAAAVSVEGMDAVSVALAGSTLASLAVGVLGALIGATEYTTGMVRATFVAVPGRTPVLWAKALVAGGVSFAVMTAGALLAFMLGAPMLDSGVTALGLGDEGVLRALVGAGAYLGLVAVLGVALGMLLRSSAASIAVLAGALLILPGVFMLLPGSLAETLSPYLPSNAGSAIMSLQTADGSLGPWAGLAVFAGYVVVALGAAAYRLKKADA
ncbi:putative ABC transporter permease protein [Actinoplanes missouriensis 431]|uniref:Putative ABC transporter permease protein n=1 Tax=Actinoplanes missouriensis (strain ATCC 14538 / DSM 43046 / CBS 188.64 / JCM 3121 / NBRC 102363 / NCIMB 12654 / NRRL B-3342 / UNCC 431) TaxID=512565 RepID=I0H6U6_ACTM4|nr:ABC transporter permease [Actinoplanes missouriensis]BAL88733.1 putative ABC transporter permease protein [Actinoplanes missouriensis 431]